MAMAVFLDAKAELLCKTLVGVAGRMDPRSPCPLKPKEEFLSKIQGSRGSCIKVEIIKTKKINLNKKLNWK
jgi:hypothetical protein